MKCQYCFYIVLSVAFFSACGQKKKDKPPVVVEQVKFSGYDISHPQVYKMEPVLDEISGISFHNGNADTVYAEQDEEGKLFSFKLGDTNIAETKFAKKGDFEDVQVCNDQVVMLRSDGQLYTFRLDEAQHKKATYPVQEFGGLLPDGEYEALYADGSANKLYILCKHCDEKASKTVSGYILSIGHDGIITSGENFTVNVKDIAAKAGVKKLRFEPSALAKNASTGDWYILSSVNKMLVVANSDWTIKEIYKLDPAVYNQPEGITFDVAGNLYISNEKGSTSAATILKIAQRKL